MNLDVREGIIVFAGGLERRVGRPVCQVEKEGPVSVGFDHPDGLVGIVVGSRPDKSTEPVGQFIGDLKAADKPVSAVGIDIFVEIGVGIVLPGGNRGNGPAKRFGVVGVGGIEDQ